MNEGNEQTQQEAAPEARDLEQHETQTQNEGGPGPGAVASVQSEAQISEKEIDLQDLIEQAEDLEILLAAFHSGPKATEHSNAALQSLIAAKDHLVAAANVAPAAPPETEQE